MTRDYDASLLAGAYALGALTDDERAEYELYLSRSSAAGREAAELEETAALLGLATEPVQPSADLKASLMAKLGSTPQHAPIVSAVSAPEVPVETRAEARAETPAEAKAKSRWFSKPAAALAAAAAAVAIFVGGTLVAGNLGSAPSGSEQQASALASINAASDNQRAVSEVAGGGTATLVWSESLGLSAMLVDGLPALPDSKTYELWYIGESGPIAAGTVDAAASGTTWIVLDGTMSAGDTVGVTVEPKGGSEQPTTDPIVAIQTV